MSGTGVHCTGGCSALRARDDGSAGGVLPTARARVARAAGRRGDASGGGGRSATSNAKPVCTREASAVAAARRILILSCHPQVHRRRAYDRKRGMTDPWVRCDRGHPVIVYLHCGTAVLFPQARSHPLAAGGACGWSPVIAVGAAATGTGETTPRRLCRTRSSSDNAGAPGGSPNTDEPPAQWFYPR